LKVVACLGRCSVVSNGRFESCEFRYLDISVVFETKFSELGKVRDVVWYESWADIRMLSSVEVGPIADVA